MQYSLTDMMPWGLNLAESVCIVGGCLLLLTIWTALQFVLKMGRMIFVIGVVVLGGAACCAAVAFGLSNL